MAADWIGISSTHYNSHCGDSGGHLLTEALDGEGSWDHWAQEVHWFVLDLTETYTITKVRGRSYTAGDPIDIDIYVSDDTENWGIAVKTGISTWQDTVEWVEIATTEKDGRYIKVVINATEYGVADEISWGIASIFDAYGEGEAVATIIPQAMHHYKQMANA